MKYGEIQKFYLLFLDYISIHKDINLCGARRNELSPEDEMYIKKLNFRILEYF